MKLPANLPYQPDVFAGTTVLVTGATGFTGSVLVRKLCEAGATVRAIARASSKIETLADLPIEWIRGEVFDPDTIKRAAADVDFIFHLAAAYREARVSDEHYHRVHVSSTELLLDAVRGNRKFRRFVHASTVGVHGHIDEPPANEEYRFNPGDMYQQTKAEGELLLRKRAPQQQTPFAVVRPAAIFGPGDRRLLKVFKLAAKPIFPILGWGKCLYHLIHVQDLANCFLACATHPNAENEIFICGNPEPVTLVEFGKTVADELGRKLRVLRIPATPFFVAGAICEILCKPLGIEPPIYRRRVAFFTKDRAFDTRKLRERLSFTYEYGNREGIVETTRWYRAQGWL